MLTPDQAVTAGKLGALIIQLQAAIDRLTAASTSTPMIADMTASVQIGGVWETLTIDFALTPDASSVILKGLVVSLKNDLTAAMAQLSALG